MGNSPAIGTKPATAIGEKPESLPISSPPATSPIASSPRMADKPAPRPGNAFQMVARSDIQQYEWNKNSLGQKSKIEATFRAHVLNELQIRHERERDPDITQIAHSIIKELGGGELVERVVWGAVYDFKMKGLKPGDERAQALVREASYYSKVRGEQDQMIKLDEFYRCADAETQRTMIRLDGFNKIADEEALSYFTLEDANGHLSDAGKRILAALEGKSDPTLWYVKRFSTYPEKIQSLIKKYIAKTGR